MTCQPLLWKQYALAWPLAKSFLAPLRSLYLSCEAFDNHDFAPDNISLSCRPKKTSSVIVLVMVTWLIYTTFYFNLLAIWCCASVFCFFGSSSSTLSLCAKIFPRPHTLFNVIHKVCMDMVFGLPCPWPTRTYFFYFLKNNENGGDTVGTRPMPKIKDWNAYCTSRWSPLILIFFFFQFLDRFLFYSFLPLPIFPCFVYMSLLLFCPP